MGLISYATLQPVLGHSDQRIAVLNSSMVVVRPWTLAIRSTTRFFSLSAREKLWLPRNRARAARRQQPLGQRSSSSQAKKGR